MTEETIFASAIEKGTPDERAAFLDVACVGDDALRRRVEALLASHADPSFLGAPAVPRPADCPLGEETRTGPNAAGPDEPLDFLTPRAAPERPGPARPLRGAGGVSAAAGWGSCFKAFDEKLAPRRGASR